MSDEDIYNKSNKSISIELPLIINNPYVNLNTQQEKKFNMQIESSVIHIKELKMDDRKKWNGSQMLTLVCKQKTLLEEILKDKTLYIEVNARLQKILGNLSNHYGTGIKIKIGDIVAMDEYECKLSSKDEMAKIPKEKIISTGPKYIMAIR